MNKLITVVLGVITMLTGPAYANDFTGVRVEVTAGVDDVINNPDATDVTYGATVGADFELVKSVIFGVEANVDNVFDRTDVGTSARLGYVVDNSVLLYGKVGYANYENVFSKNLDGFRVGGGLEVNVFRNVFVGAEYRYSDFESDVGKHGVLGKVGFRF